MIHRNTLTILLIALLTAAALPAAAQDDSPIDLTPPTLGEFDPDDVNTIDLDETPILPQVTEHAQAIWEAGQAQQRNPQTFSKVGDSMSFSRFFLVPFGTDDYQLGEHTDLQDVIDQFGEVTFRDETYNSFTNPSLATGEGFGAPTVLDPFWADPEWCEPNESPLACEYRHTNPAMALIMFGTNDVLSLEPAAFDFYLRSIMLATIEQGILPIMSTFPPRPEDLETSLLFNQIVVNIAQEYDLPLINLRQGVAHLPDYGVDPEETNHLTAPPDGHTGILDEEHLEYGYTVRNLLVLQALDRLLDDLE